MINRIFNKENLKVKLFVLSFALLTTLFYVLTGIGYLNKVSMFFAKLSVFNAKWFLTPIYKSIITQGNTIILENYRVNVNAGCDGSEIIAIFLIAVLTFPSKFTKKIPALLIGTTVLYILNLARIMALFAIGYHFNEYMDTFHNNIFPLVLVLVEFAMWFAWVQWANKPKLELAQ